MASTGAKDCMIVHDPLTLSADQSVHSIKTKSQKNKEKTGQIKRDTYEERLKLARKKLLADVPEARLKTDQRPEQIPKEKINEINASYDARLRSMRKKILGDQPEVLRRATQQRTSNVTASIKSTPPLILKADHIQDTPMCFVPTAISKNNDNKAIHKKTDDTPATKAGDIKLSVFECHQNEALSDGETATQNIVDDDVFFNNDASALEPHNTARITKTRNRGLPLSPKTHIRVTFTPKALPYGVTGVVGENASESEGWLQQDAIERFLDLQAKAREYEAKQGATYRSVKHDA